jgi:hypothetical protein
MSNTFYSVLLGPHSHPAIVVTLMHPAVLIGHICMSAMCSGQGHCGDNMGHGSCLRGEDILAAERPRICCLVRCPLRSSVGTPGPEQSTHFFGSRVEIIGSCALPRRELWVRKSSFSCSRPLAVFVIFSKWQWQNDSEWRQVDF